MAVIIREKRIMGGREFSGTKVYKSDRFVTREMKKQAEELDVYIKDKMAKIRKEFTNNGLLKLKGTKGKVLKLWYELGKHLDFIDDPKIVHPDDKKYVWRALYDHAGDLAPGPPSERANRRPESSHFSYCYKIAKYPWKLVESAGDWTAWSMFLDLAIRRDSRILEWFGKISDKFLSGSKQDWLRGVAKSVNEQFHDRDTTVLNKTELYKELNEAFEKALAGMES